MKKCPSCNRIYSDVANRCSLCNVALEQVIKDSSSKEQFNSENQLSFIKKCPTCGKIYSEHVERCGPCSVNLVYEGKLPESNSNIFAEKDQIGEYSYLRGYGGARYRLSKLLGEGGEGIVYSVESSNSVAKIYKKHVLNHEAKLRFMVEHPIPDKTTWGETGSVSLAWPTDVLYDRHGYFVGYVMPKVSGGIEIFELARGAQSKKTLGMFAGYNWMLNLKVALNLAAAVEYIHSYNVVIGDMNCKNILVNPDHTITILDCDSFDITDPSTGTHYKCCAATEDYLAPELQGRNLRDENAKFSKHTDEFALAVHIFQLLMDNRYPFSAVKFEKPKNSQAVNARLDNVAKGLCPYLRNHTGIAIPPGAPLLEEVIPSILQQDFRKTFGYDDITAVSSAYNRTTAATWREHLQSLYQGNMPDAQIVQCPDNKHHAYITQIGKCGFCEAEKRFKIATGKASSTSVNSGKQRTEQNSSGTTKGYNGYTCPYCNVPVNVNMSTCPACGRRLDWSTVSSGQGESANTGGNNNTWIYALIAAAMILAFCIFGVDSAEEKAYKSAINAFNNKQYSVAADQFERLGNYKESKEWQIESVYMAAGSEYNKKHYEKAVDLYDKLPVNYKDSKDRKTEAMVYYIDGHSDRDDMVTYSYMKKLKGQSPWYFDWDAKHKDIYSWKIELLNINTRENDYSKNDNIYYSNGVETYAHFKIVGGEPGEKLNFKTACYSGSRYTQTLNWDDYGCMNGSKLWIRFTRYYTNTTFIFYDMNDNEIGRIAAYNR